MKTKPSLKQFGKRVRYFRISQGYSQEEFAARCEITQSYLSQIECGKINTSLQHVFKISNVLKINVTDLFPPYKKFTD